MHASTAKMNLFTIAEMDKSASIYINLWIKIFYFFQQTVADCLIVLTLLHVMS